MTSDPPRAGVREALLAAARLELVEHGRAAISLRAVARRAGVSHAAPKYHFRDRAGLLTAIAAEGFSALNRALSQVSESVPRQRLAALGRAYVDFGLAHPALFDLMFKPSELHPTDPTLAQAQREAIGTLNAAVGHLAGSDAEPAGASSLTLISWTFVHGLVVLTRDGALQTAAGTARADTADFAHNLIEIFSAHVGRELPSTGSTHSQSV